MLRTALLRPCWVLIVLFITQAITQAALGQQAEDKEVQQTLDRLREAYLEAYNSHDAEAVANLYAEDADQRLPTGEVLRGREEIQQHAAATFKEHPNITLSISDQSGRFITEDVFLADGLSVAREGRARGIPPETRHTVVFQRRDGQWRIVALRLMAPIESRELK